MEQRTLPIQAADQDTLEQVRRAALGATPAGLRQRVHHAMEVDSATRHCLDIMARIRLRRACGGAR